MKKLKKIVMIMIIMLGVTSCQKEVISSCGCGEIVQLHKNKLGITKDFDVRVAYFITVKNNCSGNLKEFKTKMRSYDTNQEHCENKSW